MSSAHPLDVSREGAVRFDRADIVRGPGQLAIDLGSEVAFQLTPSHPFQRTDQGVETSSGFADTTSEVSSLMKIATTQDLPARRGCRRWSIPQPITKVTAAGPNALL